MSLLNPILISCNLGDQIEPDAEAFKVLCLKASTAV